MSSETTTRSAQGRWSGMEPCMPCAGSAIDIGSHNGWFVFKMAERGLLAVGIEHERRNLLVAKLLSVYNRSNGAGFLRFDLTPESVLRLPRVNVITYLSVFHHLVKQHGREGADAIMRALAERCDRMFFETGQYNEHPRSWTHLSFMGDDPDDWVSEYVKFLGFDAVRPLGRVPGSKPEVDRVLVMGSKQGTTSCA